MRGRVTALRADRLLPVQDTIANVDIIMRSEPANVLTGGIHIIRSIHTDLPGAIKCRCAGTPDRLSWRFGLSRSRRWGWRNRCNRRASGIFELLGFCSI